MAERVKATIHRADAAAPHREAARRPRALGVSAEVRRLSGDRVQDRRQGPPALAQRQRLHPSRIRAVVHGLAKLPNDTVIDGEVVALDEDGRPSFNALQNYGSSTTPVVYFVFDVMVLGGPRRDGANRSRRGASCSSEGPAEARRTRPLHRRARREPARPRSQSVKAQGLEGLVAKRRDSRYEPGLRSGAWHEDARQPRTGVRDRRLHRRHEARSTR